MPAHADSIPRAARFRKPRSARRGFALVEATMALSLLSVVGLMLLKLSLNVIHPRQYTLQQVLSDSYLTFERARAERIPFDSLVANNSPWPAFPNVATETVEVGKMPGGMPVTGTVTRTRIPAASNFPIDGGTGTLAVNPAAMKIWRVQSVLKYEISDRTYYKSRTVLRAQ
jgi:Tfp pilus assembly protein PilV